jgi:hypothetical protein
VLPSVASGTGADLAQSGQELARVVGPPGGLALGGPRHQVVDLGRQVRAQGRRQRDVLVDVAEGDLGGDATGEGLAAGEQLEEDHPGGVHVGAGVRGAVQHELRREVPDGPHDGAGAGARRRARGAGQPEVRDPQPPVVPGEHVLGLDVAVDQAGGVRGGQGVEDLLGGVEGVPQGERAPLDEHVAQRAPRDVLHGQVGGAVVRALVEDGHDPRVGQARGGAGLAGEAGHEAGVLGQVGVHDLQRDRPVQPGVGGQVDRRHPAPGDARAHPVAPVHQPADEGVLHGGGHRRSLRTVTVLHRLLRDLAALSGSGS